MVCAGLKSSGMGFILDLAVGGAIVALPKGNVPLFLATAAFQAANAYRGTCTDSALSFPRCRCASAVRWRS